MAFNSSSGSLNGKIPRSIWVWSFGAAITFFICSSLRHALFQSISFDLGIFDQAVYLISRNLPPISTFTGFHILGDHAAIIFYPIAILYKIYPDVHWLFAIQALTLASGIPLAWQLATQAGLSSSYASVVTFSYLFYPLVFNVNLFDFHPDVVIIPGVFGAFLALRSRKIIHFLGWIILILSAKAVLALTLIAFGLWLIIFERPKYYGALVTGLSLIWFIFTTQVVFPYYTGGEHAAVGRYSYLGDSVFEIIHNLVFQPNLILRQLISWSSLEYLLLLIIPVLWCFSRSTLKFLLPMLPQLGLNLLSTLSTQRDLIHQYSLPILPFFILVIIDALIHQKGFLKTRKSILVWIVISFLALAKPGYFWTRYLSYWESIDATQEAIEFINSSGSVLTIANIAPHLSHRPLIHQTFKTMDLSQIDRYSYDYVLLNGRYPGWGSDLETHNRLVNYLKTLDEFQEVYNRDEVFLFKHSTQ